MTVEQLLRHRSGLGDYLSHPEFEADPDRFAEPADFLPLARRQAPAFEPGTATRYSNMGFVLRPAERETIVVLSNTEPFPLERAARRMQSLLQ